MFYDRKLVLEDGNTYPGTGFGSRETKVCEIVFNTSMVGYQEILSDPSYTDQAVVMSYPLIGNYGLASEDFESRMIAPSALIVREVNDSPSNFRSAQSVPELLEDSNIPGISGVDTRKLIKSIRDLGSRRGVITDAKMPVEEALALIHSTPVRHDAVRRCSCRKKWYSRTSNPRFQVTVIDCGMKANIVRMLNRNKCNVTVVPYDAGSEEILSLHPDGVVISNGPGDPADVPETVRTLEDLRGRVPLFGICLGHQLIARSYGASTYKLKFGHRGGNHPVKNLLSGKIEITSQNHSYAVEEGSLHGTGLSASHINVLDGTVEGLVGKEDPVISLQYHPESAPGPQDSLYYFERFTELMKMRG